MSNYSNFYFIFPFRKQTARDCNESKKCCLLILSVIEHVCRQINVIIFHFVFGCISIVSQNQMDESAVAVSRKTERKSENHLITLSDYQSLSQCNTCECVKILWKTAANCSFAITAKMMQLSEGLFYNTATALLPPLLLLHRRRHLVLPRRHFLSSAVASEVQ